MSGTPVVVAFNTSQESTKTSAARTSATTGSTYFGVISEQNGQAGTQAPTDNKGNTYTQLGVTQVAAGAGSQLRVYKCENGAGGAGHTMTVSWGGNNSDASMWFIECPGVAAASIDTGSLGQDTDSSPPYTVATGTVNAAVDQFLSFISGAWAGPYDPTTTAQPFVLLDEETNSGSYWTGGVAYRNGTGATTATWDVPSSSQCALMIVGLKPAAGGGGLTGVGQIASAEAFGSPALSARLAPVGISSAQAFGTPTFGAGLHPAGISSAQAFGIPTLRATLAPAGIASAEAFGMPITTSLEVASIESAEAFGAPELDAHISLSTGIESAEAWGTPSLSAGILAVGIPSAEAFGLPLASTFIITGPSQWINTNIPSELRHSAIAGESRTTEVPAHA